MNKMRLGLSILAMAFLSFCCVSSFSCTRVLHVDPKQGVIVGRNMDWFEEMQTRLIVYPRGISREGRAAVNPIKWTSKFGSIVATSYNAGTVDGMNEKGLAVHGLWLDGSDYGARNEKIPGISLLMLMQYYLDNYATINEVVNATQSGAFQVLPFYHDVTKRWIKLHFALEDANGDSVVIEYINGMPNVYHDKKYTVMTNEPEFPKQLENLKLYEGYGSHRKLPGTASSQDRFVRAAINADRLPSLPTAREAVTGVISVLQNASPTFEAEGDRLYSRTLWRTVSDLSHHVYYFISTPKMTTVYASLDKFDLKQGAPVMLLDLDKQPTLSGDVTNQFKSVN